MSTEDKEAQALLERIREAKRNEPDFDTLISWAEYPEPEPNPGPHRHEQG